MRRPDAAVKPTIFAAAVPTSGVQRFQQLLCASILASCSKAVVTAQHAQAACVTPAMSQSAPERVIPRAERAPRLIRLEGGSFEMGSNEGLFSDAPAHRLTLPTFYLSETEVTAGQ